MSSTIKVTVCSSGLVSVAIAIPYKRNTEIATYTDIYDNHGTLRECNEIIICIRESIPVFMKDSLVPIVGEDNMIREFPWGEVL